jgi:glutathione S-transferase
MLKIWGRVNSVNVKKALWCAEELGLKYERVDAGLQYGVNKTPEYLKMNPTGLVPTIDDDGFVLWESHSIVRYLAAKHATGRLSPADLRQRADAERWMDWTYTFQKEFQRPIFWPLVRTPPEKRDPGAIEAARKICADLLKIPEQYLAAGRRYLAGNELTIADIPLGCHVQLWMRLPLERPCERPAYRKIVDIPLS